MGKADEFAMLVSGEMDDLRELGLKTFNVKLNFNQTLAIKAFANKAEMNNSEVIRHFIDAGIEAVMDALPPQARSEIEFLTDAMELHVLEEFK
jgi:hypothetical protein